MRCIAIDDEPIALSIIQNYCARDSSMSLECFTNPLQGISAVKQQCPDVVFMDIEMNDYSGLDLARELPHGSLLVFTTAHASYALDGYELNAVDFLHKPFSYDRFLSAMDRVMQILQMREKIKNMQEVVENIITIKVEYQNVKINSCDILYVEAKDNYIKINSKDASSVMTKMSIKGFMELLPECDFIRVHRSFVVNKSCVSSFTRQQVKLLADELVSLPVGRNYAENLYLAMMQIIKK
ncbi:MAG: LytTR family DNA-binding domain-containing protein [Rikenellaceae bacterium]